MQEKSIIKQNILTYLRHKGVTPYKFYKETGITRGILTQNNGLSEENTLRFLDYYKEVDPVWVLTGEGEMLRDGSRLVKEGVSEVLDEEPLLGVELHFLEETNKLLRDKIDLLEQNRELLLREIIRLGGDIGKLLVDRIASVDVTK